MDGVFYPDGDAAHERYGFGKLSVGEVLTIDLNGLEAKDLQIHIHSHGQFRKKKFKTKTRNGCLYVKRTA